MVGSQQMIDRIKKAAEKHPGQWLLFPYGLRFCNQEGIKTVKWEDLDNEEDPLEAVTQRLGQE